MRPLTLFEERLASSLDLLYLDNLWLGRVNWHANDLTLGHDRLANRRSSHHLTGNGLLLLRHHARLHHRLLHRLLHWLLHLNAVRLLSCYHLHGNLLIRWSKLHLTRWLILILEHLFMVLRCLRRFYVHCCMALRLQRRSLIRLIIHHTDLILSQIK